MLPAHSTKHKRDLLLFMFPFLLFMTEV